MVLFVAPGLLLRIPRRENIGACQDRLPPQGPNTRLVERSVDAVPPFTLSGLQHTPARNRVSVLDTGNGSLEPLSGLARQLLQHGSIDGDRFQRFGYRPDEIQE